MVRKVVSPASSSVRIVVPCLARPKKRSIAGTPDAESEPEFTACARPARARRSARFEPRPGRPVEHVQMVRREGHRESLAARWWARDAQGERDLARQRTMHQRLRA